MTTEPGSSRQLPRSSPYLSRLQRLSFFGGAFIFGGLGFLAVFKSENEAGTAIALLLAGVLLLVGIQGTPLLKISAGDKSIELQHTRQVMAEKARVEAGERPIVANAIIDAYEAADPDASRDPSFAAVKASIYELQAKLALQRVSAELELPREAVPRHLADVVLCVSDRLLLCDIRYSSTGRRRVDQLNRAKRIRDQISQFIDRSRDVHGHTVGGVLIITSQHSFAATAEGVLRDLPVPVRLQCWKPEDGDGPIKEALLHVSEALKSAEYGSGTS
jgi:hypothetical protein